MRQKIKHKDLDEWLDEIRLSRLTPMILGSVGVGKTQHGCEYAKAHNLEPIIIPLDAMYEMDVVGYAVPNKETRKFHYFPSTFFPVEGDEIPKGKDGWLIIIDEFGNCGASMQTAAQRLIFERIVGQHKLHDKAEFLILGNTIEAGANANPISNAVLSRCAVAELLVTKEDFVEYLESKNYPTVLCDVYMSMMTAATVVNASPPDETSGNAEQVGQEAIFTHRGYEELCKIVLGKANLPSDCIEVLKDMSLESSRNTVKTVLGEYYGAMFNTAVSKLLASINSKYAAFIQASGAYTLGIGDIYLLPTVIGKLFKQPEYHTYMNNFITHNLKASNTEALSSILVAIEQNMPELIQHSQYDRIKAQLL